MNIATGLTGHTITIEPVTRDLCARTGLPLGAVGTLAVVERGNGHLIKVCETAAEDPGITLADVARSYARGYGATYVEEGPA